MSEDEPLPARIGPYQVLRRLGRGGMGVVYEARDERSGAIVALKTIAGSGVDETAKRRFAREGRTAARVDHPRICRVHETGETDGLMYIAMERLEGEGLSDRLRRGPADVSEAVRIGSEILEGLAVLHANGIVHRDLKPSNVHLTPTGTKLLDFGLAREVRSMDASDARTDSLLTQAGTVVGTPHYVSPEQLRGEPLDARADLFAVAAILFEMLSGRRAFDGRGMLDVLQAVLHESPPALAGSDAAAALDAVVRRGLAKRPDERFQDAASMAEALRGAGARETSGATIRARPLTRLLVLPFRVLRPDADTDFLAFSLPDAITSSLAGLESLVVRSSLTASRFAGAEGDLARIAREAEVDAVVTGSLLRAGERVQVRTELVEVPGGAVVSSQTSHVALGDVFALQDQLVEKIVSSLAVPLTAREHRALHRDAPATARAYEFYLRGNQLALDSTQWRVARDMYRRCLDEDPRYAPALARLGRMLRLLAKYQAPEGGATLDEAREALEKALELQPDLGLAHSFMAQYEVEAGRPIDALRRLLRRSRVGRVDAELFAGLVHACRYCGLLDASLAADRVARRLDPGVRTSVSYTHFMRGDYPAAIAADIDDARFVTRYAKVEQGPLDAALLELERMERETTGGVPDIARTIIAALRGDAGGCVAAIGRIVATGFKDPEGLYFQARALSRVGEKAAALDLLERVIDGGFFCAPRFEVDSWLEPVRPEPRFGALMARAHGLRDEARRVFKDEGGEVLLGTA